MPHASLCLSLDGIRLGGGPEPIASIPIDPRADSSQPRPYQRPDAWLRPMAAAGVGMLSCAAVATGWDRFDGGDDGRAMAKTMLAATGGALVAATSVYAWLRPVAKVGRGDNAADPSLWPRLDPRAQRLAASAAPLTSAQRQAAMALPVDRRIHQIWLGYPARLAERDQCWRRYAEQFDLSYQLWSEASLATLPMLANNRKIYEHALLTRNWWLAADIARLELLAQHGGIYIDVDWRPPAQQGAFMAPDALMPMRGLTLITEPYARDIGCQHGVFFNNSFVAAGAGHPLIAHARAGLAQNWASAVSNLASPVLPGSGRAMYASGPFMLNRMLSGPINLLTFADAERLGMVNF